MRIATSTNLFEFVSRDTSQLYYTTEQSLQGIAAAGFQAADLCFYNCCKDGHPFLDDTRWEAWADGLGQLADSLSLPMNQAHAVILSAEELEQREHLVLRCIAAAGRLQIPWLVIHPYTLRDEVWYSHRKSLEFSRQAFTRYLAAAARHGVGMCVENLAENRRGMRTFGASTEDLLTLVEALEDERLGICWDTGHAHLNNLNQPAAIRQMGKRLQALHVNDNLADRDAHLAPYMGSINWQELLQALAAVGYAGDFTYEIQGYTNALPAELHDAAAAELFSLGRWMLQFNHLEASFNEA